MKEGAIPQIGDDKKAILFYALQLSGSSENLRSRLSGILLSKRNSPFSFNRPRTIIYVSGVNPIIFDRQTCHALVASRYQSAFFLLFLGLTELIFRYLLIVDLYASNSQTLFLCRKLFDPESLAYP